MDFLKLAFLNFFIPLRQDEAITWDNFVTAKQDPGIPKEGSCLPGMKLFTCNSRISLMKSITLPGFRQNGTELLLGQPGSFSNHLSLL